MRKSFPKVSLLLILVFVMLFVGNAVFSTEALDGEQLVLERCTQCHNLMRVERAMAMKDRGGWERTVDRMISKREGLLNTEERAAIINHLTQK